MVGPHHGYILVAGNKIEIINYNYLIVLQIIQKHKFSSFSVSSDPTNNEDMLNKQTWIRHKENLCVIQNQKVAKRKKQLHPRVFCLLRHRKLKLAKMLAEMLPEKCKWKHEKEICVYNEECNPWLLPFMPKNIFNATFHILYNKNKSGVTLFIYRGLFECMLKIRLT